MPDLNDGEMVEMKGSSANPYILRNVGDVYSCACPAWRNQLIAIERRTCKHLRKLRGEAAELARIGQEIEPAASGVFSAGASEPKGPALLLAKSWDNHLDLTDWWMSEKLDGVRAYWDGREFRSERGTSSTPRPDSSRTSPTRRSTANLGSTVGSSSAR
jgi:DNA ligase-1